MSKGKGRKLFLTPHVSAPRRVECIPSHGDVAAFEVEPSPAAGVCHVTVIDRDADDGQALITGALDAGNAAELAALLFKACGLGGIGEGLAELGALRAQVAHMRAALGAIKRVCHGRTPGVVVEDLAQCANLATQGVEGEPLVGDPAVYDLANVRD